MTYFKIIFLPLLLLLSAFHINCLETIEQTQVITQTSNISLNELSAVDTFPTATAPATIPAPAAIIKSIIDNAPFILSDKHKDDDDKKKEKKKKHKKHKNSKKHDGDDDANVSKTINPTTTIYTTIYIIATETPTQIYTGTNQPAKQKGQKSDSDQIGDPNSPLTDGDSDGDDDDDDDDDNSNTSQTGASSEQNSGDNNNQDNTQVRQGHSASYKRLVVALSVIGSTAGVILFIAAFVFTRRRVIKKKHHSNINYPKDLEMGKCSLLPPPPPPHRHIPPPPRTLAHSSYRMNITQHHDGESTLIDFGNPFNDPTEEKSRSTDLTSEVPVYLNPETYIDFRQNQTLSLLSQTTAAEPSAPTEKELNRRSSENPFEEQEQEIPLYYSMNQSTIYPIELDQNNPGTNSSEDGHQSQITSLTTHQPTESHPTDEDRHQSITAKSQETASDLPPPAYTPSAIPSAPPLYALPTLSRSQMTELGQSPPVNSSRRHSVSSSILSEYRPLSLRRGSGSLAFISSPIS